MTLKELLPPVERKAYRRRTPPPGGWPRRDTPEELLKSDDEAHRRIRLIAWGIRVIFAGIIGTLTVIYRVLLLLRAVRGH